ncbi:HMG box-containing protein 4-like isoform X2 [Ctenocephalides felis]|uniref:HMG box-containing protein 4-like isoform X2 n=1 Tax=Ctenocephalides felis TaxID=7515 RepID=UPI000E6E15CB|nr:HMG box-containing protein 4-like isoform X2 [Ctenocephalides felis]
MYTNDKSLKSKREDPDQIGRKPKQEDLEVTGVSRSGRVRKKSSKLTDFESPDDLEPRPKKSFTKPHTSNFDFPSGEENRVKVEYDIQEQHLSDGESEEAYDSNLENDSNVSEDDSDVDLEENDLNEHQDFENTPSQSVYLQELSRKKSTLLRDSKSPAKGELWANVPNGEKYNWRRRAKRMAMKVARDEEIKTSDNKAQFINKSKSNKPSQFSTSPTVSKKLDIEDLEVMPNSQQNSDNLMLSPKSSAMSSGLSSQGMYKVTGSSPIDIAAYLKLLGESLSIIGERLKEHEGQIAVSGSLSVLLDSLLCSVGPLVCLSQQVPELNSDMDFSDLLDNIAYVMPGL